MRKGGNNVERKREKDGAKGEMTKGEKGQGDGWKREGMKGNKGSHLFLTIPKFSTLSYIPFSLSSPFSLSHHPSPVSLK